LSLIRLGERCQWQPVPARPRQRYQPSAGPQQQGPVAFPADGRPASSA